MKKGHQNLTSLRKWRTQERTHLRHTDNYVTAKKVWPDLLTNNYYINVGALLERLRRGVALLIKASVYVILLKQGQQRVHDITCLFWWINSSFATFIAGRNNFSYRRRCNRIFYRR